MPATLTAQPVNYSLPGAYQQQQLDAENAYQQALNNIAQQQASLSNQKGFQYQQGDDGTINNVQIDPTNQYSEIMGLLGQHAGQFRDLRGQLAGRGLGGKVGLAAKRLALMKFIQGGETSNVGKSFLDQLSGLQNQKAGALSSRNSAFNAAEQAAAQYAIQQQQFAQAQAAAQQQMLAYQQALAQYQAGGGDTGGGGGDTTPVDTSGGVADTGGLVSPLGGNTFASAVPTASGVQAAAPYTTASAFKQAYGDPFAYALSSPTPSYTTKSTTNYQAKRNAY